MALNSSLNRDIHPPSFLPDNFVQYACGVERTAPPSNNQFTMTHNQSTTQQ